jgi:hypothetical protein
LGREKRRVVTGRVIDRGYRHSYGRRVATRGRPMRGALRGVVKVLRHV